MKYSRTSDAHKLQVKERFFVQGAGARLHPLLRIVRLLPVDLNLGHGGRLPEQETRAVRDRNVLAVAILDDVELLTGLAVLELGADDCEVELLQPVHLLLALHADAVLAFDSRLLAVDEGALDQEFRTHIDSGEPGDGRLDFVDRCIQDVAFASLLESTSQGLDVHARREHTKRLGRGLRGRLNGNLRSRCRPLVDLTITDALLNHLAELGGHERLSAHRHRSRLPRTDRGRSDG